MRAKAGIPLACLGAFSLVICLENGLQAQTPPSAGVSRQDSANDLSVAVGKTVLVDCAKPVSRVSIGLGDIAEVQAVSPTEILVNGKTAGETNLIIWDRSGGRQFFNVSVRASDAVANDNLDAVRREIRTELPGQTIKVTYDNGNVFLRGTVKTLNNSNRAAQIAAVAGKVVNLLYIDVPASESQILLKVRFASVDRSKEKQLGINLFSTGYGNVIGGVTTGQYSPPSVTPGTGGAASSLSLSNELNLFAFLPGLDLGATLQAMETRGLVELLAEPNLLSESGKEATFLAGGEFPYPVAQASAGGGSTISIQFKEYGVRLSFIPTVTPRGTIHLQVAPEVSALDFSNALTLSGFTVPAINVRNVNTEVELGDGQSFAIGGLMDNTESDTFVKIPFLGDIPILGKFFQSMTRSKGNTELIVIVTPQIVAPIEAGAAVPVLKYPEKFLPPNSGIPMTTPENKVAGATPPPPTLPVEKLIDSMKPEKPLIIQGVSGAFGSGATLGGGATASPTPPQ